MSGPYGERRGGQWSERSSANDSGGHADTPTNATNARHTTSHSLATSVEFDGPNPFLDPPEPPRPHRAAWALPTDVFWERYGAVIADAPSGAGSFPWRPLPHLQTLSGAAAFPPSAPTTAPSGSPSDGFSTAAGGHVEPWLLHGLGPSLDTGPAKSGGLNTDRPRLLFQYKPYSQQEALSLTPPEVAAVIEAVFGKFNDPHLVPAVPGTPSPLTPPPPAAGGFLSASPAGTPTPGGGSIPSALSSASDTAAVVLIKLIIDMYLRLGPEAAFPLVLYMLQRPLLYGSSAGRCRVFDLISNLAVHGELLHAAPADDVPEDDDEVAQAVAGLDRSGPSGDWRTTVTSALRASLAMAPENSRSGALQERTESHAATMRNGPDITSEEDPTWPPLPRPAPCTNGDPRVERFRHWLRLLLYRLLSMLCSADGAVDAAWAAGLSCLVALAAFEGEIVRSYVEDLPLNVVAALLEQGKERLWPESLMCWLGGLAANLLYVPTPPPAPATLKTTTNGGSGTYRARSGTGSARHQKRPSQGQGHQMDASYCSGTQIDTARLEAFGGTRAVARWFRLAPTVRSRRAFFCVLYDCAMGPQSTQVSRMFNGGYYDAEAVASLGCVLLHVRAADAVHAIATSCWASTSASSGNASGTDTPSENALFQDVADRVCAQLTASGSPVQPEYVDECFSALENMLLQDTSIPRDLERSFQGTLTELRGGVDAQTADWDTLEDALRDTSALGKSIAGSWLLQVLITAAAQEMALPSFGAGGHPVALLPAPDIRTASWKAREVVAMSSCPGLKRLLADALPDPGGAAADTFIRAVKGLLDNLRLRAAAELGPVVPAKMSSKTSPSTSAPQAAQETSATFKISNQWTWEHTHAVALSTLIIAVDWLALVPAPVRRPAMVAAADCLVSWLVVRRLETRTYSEHDNALIPGISHDDLNGSSAVPLSIHVPHGGDGGGGAGPGGGTPGAPSSPFTAEATGGAGGAGNGAPGTGAGSAAETAVSSLSKLVPVPKLAAAWRRFTAPHAARPRPPTAAGSAQPEPPVRPLSAGMAVIGGAPVPGSAAELHTALPPTPERDSSFPGHTDAAAVSHQGGELGEDSQAEQSRQDQRALTGGHSLFDAAAERAAAEEAVSGEAAQVAARTLAELEAGVGAVGSFLEGLSGCPVELLNLTEPGYLRAVFDALRPPEVDVAFTSERHTPSPTPPWAGRKASAGRGIPSSAGVPAAASRMSAVQAGRPLWDARSAVLALLLARCSLVEDESGAEERDGGRKSGGGDDGVTSSTGALDAMFLSSLLTDADVRVRRQASVYVLRRLSQQGVGKYRAAMRAVVARAQRAGDERLLLSPEAQVQAMGEMRLLHLETLV